MSHIPLDSVDADFSDQLEILANQAAQQMEVRAPKSEGNSNLSELLRPLLQGMEALGRAASQNAEALERIEKAASEQASLPAAITAMQVSVAQKSAVSQKLFDAMHEELRTYKDGFLLEVFHKPIVRDLITLYDDLSRLEQQTDAFVTELSARTDSAESETPALQQMRTISTNLNHGLLSLVETMARMELAPLPPHVGKIEREGQKAVSIEAATKPEDDGMIACSVRPGFQWRGRTMRPEEVVLKRWKAPDAGDSQ